jgi:hypothetical protein
MCIYTGSPNPKVPNERLFMTKSDELNDICLKLMRYVRHVVGCGKTLDGNDAGLPCTCGLDQVILEHKAATEPEKGQE